MTTDHYSTLGVPKDADEKTIKRAYRRKATKAHPDHGGTEQEMAKLNAAWECLGNAQRRLTYDRTGHDGEGPPPEEAGRGFLLEAFDKVLSTGGGDYHILSRVGEILNKQIAEYRQQQRVIDAGVAGLTRARDKVRKKKSAPNSLNVYHVLIDKRLQELKAASADIVHKIESFKEALRLLGEYESDPETIFVIQTTRGTTTYFPFRGTT